MLFLTRKMGESIIINDDIHITIREIRGKTVKLGFEYPKNTVKILRQEIYERIQEENRQAVSKALEVSEVLSNTSFKKTAEKPRI